MSDRLHEGFSAPGNKILIRQLIRRSLPHDIHDYALDGTGGGKTYISGYVIALQELAKLPETHPLKTSPLRKMPPNPLTIVVFPTKGLQVEMEQTLRALNISALAINEDTLPAAGQQN
ncbi:hypothetical protein K435DRAFT_870882 [Dendrothele bispora CBS 962.96]|uniref:DEAD/DEAH box helicase domain-containing protein n=1 Tax=Dendrothele bispora (strain CBS 962.96) TaxID=1314807 RepID=A0A4S8L601_DENBC|nr:hypothetical protein K435DRAFT_870882 [Dendrothele bispora CBS 962.96]